MPAKSQPAPAPLSAVELFRTLQPWNAENRRQIALAFLEEQGDLPSGIVYSFCRVVSSDEGEALMREMTELREQHFAKLGQPVPEHSGPRLR